MTLRVIAVGKIRDPAIADVCHMFRKRLAPYRAYEEIEVKASDGSDPTRAKREEAQRIIKLLRADERAWLLERRGTHLSSEELAEKLEQTDREGLSRLSVIVAGTYGADAALIERADFLWSLSHLTFLHEWARMLVIEQLYRAAKITRSEPYHH